MIFCCDGFKVLLSTSARVKGFSVVASCEYNKRIFCLRARPFESDMVEKHGSINWLKLRNTKGVAVTYAFQMEMAISYCPFCGKNLTDLINKDKKEFDRLAEETAKLKKEEMTKLKEILK